MTNHKLTSRKFLLALAAAASVFLSEAFGLELSPEAIAGIVGSVAAYVFGEAAVDRRAVEASMKEIQLTALDTASLYARQLESQLNIMREMRDTENVDETDF